MRTHLGDGGRIYNQSVLNITVGGFKEEMKLIKGLVVHFRFWGTCHMNLAMAWTCFSNVGMKS